MGKSRRNPHGKGANDHWMVNKLDKLAEFEEFSEDILPALREALKKGSSAEDIYNLVQAAAAARAASIALTDKDPAKALAAIKDILDRTSGKATEKQEVTHKLEKLPDDQLDSLLLSKLKDTELDDDEDAEHLLS